MFRKRRLVTPSFRTMPPFNPMTGKYAQLGPERKLEGIAFHYRGNVTTGPPDYTAFPTLPEPTGYNLPVTSASGEYYLLATNPPGFAINADEEKFECQVEGFYAVFIRFEYKPRDSFKFHVALDLTNDKYPGGTQVEETWYRRVYEDASLHDMQTLNLHLCQSFYVGWKVHVSVHNYVNVLPLVHGDPQLRNYSVTFQRLGDFAYSPYMVGIA